MSKQTKKNYTPVYKKSTGKGKNVKGRSGEALILFKKRIISLSSIALSLAIVLTLSLVFATYQPPIRRELPATTNPDAQPSASGRIVNGDFQVTLNAGRLAMYPHTPQNWTITNRRPHETLSGVISLSDDRKARVERDLRSQGIPESFINDTVFGTKLLDDPRVELDNDRYKERDYQENVMMLYNPANDGIPDYIGSYQKVVSTSFSMWGGDYKVIRVWAKTAPGTQATITLRTSATTTTEEVPAFTVGNLSADEWHPYDIYLEADPSWSKTFVLEFALGTSGAPQTGLALFALAEMNDIKKAEYIAMHYVNEGDFTAADDIIIPARSVYGDLAGLKIDEENELVTADGKSQLPRSWKRLRSYDERREENKENVFWKDDGGHYDVIEEKAADKRSQNVTEGIASDWELDMPFYYEGQTVYRLQNFNTIKAKERENQSRLAFETLTIPPSTASSHYRVSFWIKTEGIRLNTGVYAYMNSFRTGDLDPKDRPIRDDDKSAYFNNLITNEPNKSEPSKDTEKNSGWQQIVFYVKPSNTDEYTLDLTISLGKISPLLSDLVTYGTVYITEFELFEISKSDYNSNSGSNNTAKTQRMDLEFTADSGSIHNGYFNAPINNATADSNLGLSPKDWNMRYQQTPDSTEGVRKHYEDVTFGILPRGSKAEADYFMPTADVPDFYQLPGSDNVFGMIVGSIDKTGTIKSGENGAFAVRSNTFTIGARSTILVSLLVYANDWKFVDVSLKAPVTSAEDEQLSMSYNYDNFFSDLDYSKLYNTPIDTNGGLGNRVPSYKDGYDGWVKLNFLVTTGELSKQAFIEVSLGTTDDPADAGSFVVLDAVRTDTINASRYRQMIFEEGKDKEDDKSEKWLAFYKTVEKGEKGRLDSVTFTRVDSQGNVVDDTDTLNTNIRIKDFTVDDQPEEEEWCEICDEPLNKCWHSETDYKKPDPTPRKPVQWELIVSLPLVVVLLFTIGAVLVRRFLKYRKRESVEFDDEYKR